MKKLLKLAAIGILAAFSGHLCTNAASPGCEITLPSAAEWEDFSDALRESISQFAAGFSVTQLPESEEPQLIIRMG